MKEAQELLNGARHMAIYLDELQRNREKLIASVAGAKSPKIRDPEMIVQFSRDTSDHMADVVAEVSDLDDEIEKTREALRSRRERLRKMIRRINRRDLIRIMRLYYLSPFKVIRKHGAERRELRTWNDIADIMNLTRDPVMKRKKKLEEKVDELIRAGM